MSYTRWARGVRAIGGFSGGTSRLARPPAVLPEPDIRPTEAPTECVITIHAASTGNTYSQPRGAVALDEAGMSNPCELDVGIVEPNTVPAVLFIPPGDYAGITVHVVWDAGVTAETYVDLYDDEGGTFLDQDLVSGALTPEDLSIGPFTITGTYGHVHLIVDWFPNMAPHTVDPATVITITKTA